MGQVAITLNDRIYRLVCDDGEEDRLVELAEYVKGKIAALTADIGSAGHERVLLMAALMIADELWDARASLQATGGGAVGMPSDVESNDPEPVKRLKRLAERMSAPQGGDAGAFETGNRSGSKSRRRDVG